MYGESCGGGDCLSLRALSSNLRGLWGAGKERWKSFTWAWLGYASVPRMGPSCVGAMVVIMRPPPWSVS
eukprot:12911148-Prorocentrum_lima.AAC.1